MPKLECRECGYTDDWETLNQNTVPADAENAAKAADGRVHTAAVVCPDCGHSGFDRLGTEGDDA